MIEHLREKPGSFEPHTFETPCFIWRTKEQTSEWQDARTTASEIGAFLGPLVTILSLVGIRSPLFTGFNLH